MVPLEFSIDIILPAAMWSWVDSASNRNEYQEYFLGGKGGRCVGLTTFPPPCADCLEIWEPQGLSRPVMGLLCLLPICIFSEISSLKMEVSCTSPVCRSTDSVLKVQY